jgi:hypothetical protein
MKKFSFGFLMILLVGLLGSGSVFAQEPVKKCGVKTVIQWAPNTESDLEGYNVFMSPNAADLADVTGMAVAKNVLASEPLTNGAVRVFIPLSGLSPEVMNYFVVTAYDTSKNESVPSVVVSCDNNQIPGQVQGVTIINIP